MATIFVYDTGDDFSDGVDLGLLATEIAAAAIVPELDLALTMIQGTTLTLVFDAGLSTGEETTLHGDASPPAGGSVLGDHAGPQAELTLAPAAFEARLAVTFTAAPTMADAVTTTDQTEIDIYLLPYKGERIALYDGTVWSYHSLGANGISIDNAGLAKDQNYDVFVHDNSGTLALELLIWTAHGAGSSTRTALGVQDGVYVRGSDDTRRYVGTVRTIDVGGTVKFTDAAQQRFVWNYYNRVDYADSSQDSTNSWTDAGNSTFSAINGGNAAWKHELVVGVNERVYEAEIRLYAANDYIVAVGLDSTSVVHANSTMLYSSGGTIATATTCPVMPGIGYHYLQGLESSTGAGSVSAFGDAGVAFLQTGMYARGWR